MTSPWPAPDYEKQVAMCCLCFEGKKFEELSRNAAGELTDVCMDCRQKELQAVLKQIELILDTDNRAIQGPQFRNAELTQHITFTVLGCGHIADCACHTCHRCEGFCVYA